MQLHRRALLAGASAMALALLMPTPSKPLLDKEALRELANHIATNMECRHVWEWRYLFANGTNKTIQEIEAEWLDKDRSIEATDRQLKLGFRRLQQEARIEGYQGSLLEDGKLSFRGQYVVLDLPLAPSDWSKDVFALLARLAPHYLEA